MTNTEGLGNAGAGSLTTLAGWMLIVGGALVVAGVFLPWTTAFGRSSNGLSSYSTAGTTVAQPGTVPLVGYGRLPPRGRHGD